MTILRNKSGGVASLYSVGAINIANDGDFDTMTIADGQPLALQVKLQGSSELRAAIDAGQWCVVADGEELSAAESAAAIESASVEDAETAGGLILRKSWFDVAPNPASNTYFDVLEVPVADGKATGISVDVFVRSGADASLQVGSAPFVFTARRRTGESVEVPSAFRLFQSEGGMRFRVEERPATFAIQARRRGTGAVRIAYNGTWDPES